MTLSKGDITIMRFHLAYGQQQTDAASQHTPERHTAECRETFRLIKATHEAWVTQWPHYCRTCDAQGRWQDGSWESDGGAFDVCEDCAGQNHCPPLRREWLG